MVRFGLSRLFTSDSVSTSAQDASASTTSASLASTANAQSESPSAATLDANQDATASSIENVQGSGGTEALDLAKLLGPTRDGRWMPLDRAQGDKDADNVEQDEEDKLVRKSHF